MSHPLHVLTPLTGKEAAERRTVIIAGIELNARLGMILAASAVPALLITLMTLPILGVSCVLVFPLVLIASGLAFYRRSADGMRLRMYQQIRDKYRAEDVETFFMCGIEIELDDRFEDVYSASVPVHVDAVAPAYEAVLDVFSARPDHQSVDWSVLDLYAVGQDQFAAIEKVLDEQREVAQETWTRATVGGHPVDHDDYSDIFASRRGNRRK